jgi:acetyl-CoA carboxylase beta subunit
MSWHSFIVGVVSTLFAYALFSSGNEEEEHDPELTENDEDGIEVHDFQSRHVTLSCQSCRKLKKHKEIKPNLFQCVKCKRHVDLRAS